MKIPYGKIGPPLMLLSLAGVVGLQVGPPATHRPAKPKAAIRAAQGFVENSVKNRGGHNGPLKVTVVFRNAAPGAISAEQDTSDPNLWRVTGTATAGSADIHWAVKEQWDGVHRWIPKAVEVWRL